MEFIQFSLHGLSNTYLHYNVRHKIVSKTRYEQNHSTMHIFTRWAALPAAAAYEQAEK